ncbi:MAG: hypothetical protein ACO1OB_27485 [Archangium sp.]
MVPYAEKAKEKGPPVEPVDALKAWLEASGDRVVRVPLTVTKTPPSDVDARIGSMPVEVDDSALGISLAERVRMACAEEKTCTVWVEGRWRGGALKVIHFAREVVPQEKADFVEREL